MQQHRPLPEPIANAPEMPLGLAYYYKAFQELCSERGEGPIPGSAIRAFCRDEELDEEMTDDLKYYVRVLDNTLLEYIRKKNGD